MTMHKMNNILHELSLIYVSSQRPYKQGGLFQALIKGVFYQPLEWLIPFKSRTITRILLYIFAFL